MPPEIHFLVPLMVLEISSDIPLDPPQSCTLSSELARQAKAAYQVLPSSLLTAVVLRPATSEPAKASEMASEMTCRSV